MSPLLQTVRASSPEGEKVLELYARRGSEVLDREVVDGARRLIDRVRRKGDRGLLAAVKRHDGVSAKTVRQLARDPRAELEADRESLPRGFAVALERAIWAVERYHRDRLEAGFRLRHDGVELKERRVPLRRVGVYIPGGKATYPSTAVMTVVPARLAGVDEIAVVTPPSAYDASPRAAPHPRQARGHRGLGDGRGARRRRPGLRHRVRERGGQDRGAGKRLGDGPPSIWSPPTWGSTAWPDRRRW